MRLTSPSDPLNPPDFDQFANSCAISGKFIIVGAHLDNPNGVPDAGSAYIFGKTQGGPDNWGLVATLTAVNPFLCVPDLNQGDNFGASVAIDGDIAIVGAPFDDDGCLPNINPNCDSGAAYIFRRDSSGNWNCEAKFIGQNAGDNYGAAVDIAQDSIYGIDMAVVGAPLNDYFRDGVLIMDAGAAYVMRSQPDTATWGIGIPYRFTAPSTGDFAEIFENALFGNDVACWRSANPDTTEDRVAVGAHQHHLTGTVVGSDPLIECFPTNDLPPFNDPYGAAYVFERAYDLESGFVLWDSGSTLLPVGCDNTGHFGRAIDIEDTRVTVSSNLDFDSIHVFALSETGNGWEEQMRLSEISPVGGANTLGNAVAISGGTMMAGAFDEFISSSGLTDVGSVYVFNGLSDCNNNGVLDTLDICEFPELDCNGNGSLDTCDLANGSARDCNTNGVPDSCDLFCVADITPINTGGNCTVNIDDLVAVLNGFGVCPVSPAVCPSDITPAGGNGVVNIDDLVMVLNEFGSCGSGGPSAGGANGITLEAMDFSNGWMDENGVIDTASAALVAGKWLTYQNQWDVYRLWVTVDDQNSTLTFAGGGVASGVGGTSESLVLNSGKNGAFYVPSGNYSQGVNVALLAFDGGPGLEWFQTQAFGTYLAMGTASNGIVPGKMGDTAALDGILTGSVNEANTGWSVIGPAAGQGVVPDGNGGWRVLIGQFAVPEGEPFTAAVRLVGDDVDTYATISSGTPLP